MRPYWQVWNKKSVTVGGAKTDGRAERTNHGKTGDWAEEFAHSIDMSAVVARHNPRNLNMWNHWHLLTVGLPPMPIWACPGTMRVSFTALQ